jgi:hypothetical protein
MNKTLDLKALVAIQEALERFYPRELGLEGSVEFKKWGEWPSKEVFWEQLKTYPEFKNIKTQKEASGLLQKLIDEKTKGAEAPGQPDSNLPQNREANEELRKKSEELHTETREGSKQAVETMQKRQQEMYEEAQKLKKQAEELKNNEQLTKDLTGKKIYAKIEVEDTPSLDEDKQQKLERYKELSKNKPETAKEELAKELEVSIEKQFAKEDLTKEEIKSIARETASETIETLSKIDSPDYVPTTYQTAILTAVAVDDKVVPKVAISKSATEIVKNSAGHVAVFKIQPELLTRGIIETAFGKDFTNFVLGVDPSKVEVTLVETIPQNLPREELVKYKEVNLQNIRESHTNILEWNSSVLEKASSVGKGYADRYMSSGIANFITRRIEALPVNSVVKKVVTTPEMQAMFFAKFGVGSPVVWQYANPTLMKLFGQNQLAGAAFSTVGRITGKPIVTAVTGEVAGQVAGKVATQAAGKATGAGLGATIGAITGLSGGPLAIVTAAVGYVIGEVFGKVISKLKVWWTKNKDKIAPILGVGVGLSFARFGFGPAILGGAGTYLLFGGTATALLFGPMRFFAILGRNIGITIATPVIVTLLVLPPLVAFIMLVINNSAYVVPPSPLSFNRGGVITSPYIDITKTATPPGPFENSDLPLTVTYTITIKAKKGPLTNIKIDYACRVVKSNSSTVCPEPNGTIPTTTSGISPSAPFVFSYSQTYDPLNFEDSFVTDTVTITADEPSAKNIQAAAAATIKIGEPPEECPTEELWPTSNGVITQGAYTNGSHKGTESIDIGVSSTNVFTTHSGVVVFSGFDSCYGNEIKIKSSCGGKEFISRYSHLEARSVTNGASVSMGQVIGRSGNTGTCTTGPHVHYEFRFWPDGKPSWPNNPPFMMRPYIPRDVPRGCENSISCGVSF